MNLQAKYYKNTSLMPCYKLSTE